jgi:hypothetical protein
MKILKNGLNPLKTQTTNLASSYINESTSNQAISIAISLDDSL